MERKQRATLVTESPMVVQHAGNHGQSLKVFYNKKQDTWRIELRPLGPGSITLLLNREAMKALSNSYKEKDDERIGEIGEFEQIGGGDK